MEIIGKLKTYALVAVGIIALLAIAYFEIVFSTTQRVKRERDDYWRGLITAGALDTTGVHHSTNYIPTPPAHGTTTPTYDAGADSSEFLETIDYLQRQLATEKAKSDSLLRKLVTPKSFQFAKTTQTGDTTTLAKLRYYPIPDTASWSIWERMRVDSVEVTITRTVLQPRSNWEVAGYVAAGAAAILAGEAIYNGLRK